jgi:rubrerythrin
LLVSNYKDYWEEKAMSLFGVTKGTELEKQIDQYLEGETRGVAMYHGLARLARERGLDDVAVVLLKLAADEARHAGLYAVLNGRIPQDIFVILNQVAQLESDAMGKIKDFAHQVRMLGLDDAAKEIEAAAEDEGRHGQVLQELLRKYSNS